MKSIKIVVVSFLSGIGGAWFFSQVSPQAELQINHPIAENYSQQVSKTELYEPANYNPPVSFVEASERSKNSVVFIKNFSGSDPRRNSMFDYFFGTGPTQRVSTGSGVIISGDGYIVTNNHVIDRAETIEVVHQKRTYKAKLIGTDKNTDIAVLKIEAENLPAIAQGSSRELRIGEWVIAVGNPFNLTSTVTAGIVSAKERQINILGGDFPLESFIQTDAPINPGNSGGALVNTKGELVGINTAILSRTGSYTGYGFAVPVDIAIKVANDLIKFGEVQKALPGVEVVEITPELAEEMNLQTMDGVIVTHVQRNGAAERAGLRKNDVIFQIEDINVSGKGSFEEAISYFYPGDKIKFNYIRENRRNSANVTLLNLEGGTGVLKREFYSSNILGGRLEAVNTIERDRLDIDHGIKITGMTRGYLRELGLANGFIITHINKEPATDPTEIGEFLEKYSGRLLLEGVSPNGQRFMQSYNVR
ncbi:trypsin-like peptidase domain-containing protein [Litoribacter ruber]|uniref:Trypsin-like peptidase domain-containing protein n=1 Tax=Litoribacter ruber TaxID=702568 RepID=A0AAP2G1Y2_9BACT|nr:MULTISPECIES: trypsin-like peptidase domain-containing protein [Litoribacter]MBS9524917.1 trypsin-like peptidase domain-containing protein [Litoribacter alkaliphilus]MBT0811922.1 trypsin-like peptidase domain-containing protein [Litoribacter ruber]